MVQPRQAHTRIVDLEAGGVGQLAEVDVGRGLVERHGEVGIASVCEAKTAAQVNVIALAGVDGRWLPA